MWPERNLEMGETANPANRRISMPFVWDPIAQ
jgi:hypothetical protein